MKRNKKLISLICAIAMIFSMLSGLAITASAEGEGFTISEPVLASDGRTVTFSVGYEGSTNGLKSGGFTIDLAAFTSAKATDSALVASSSFNDKLSPQLSYSFTAVKGTPDASGTIVTFEVVLAEEVSKDVPVKISEGNIYDNKNAAFDLEDKTVAIPSGVVVHNPAAPTAKPTTDQARPTPVAVPTANPDATAEPTLAPAVTPAEGEPGYTISEPAVTDSGKTITFTVGYTGLTNGLKAGGFSFTLPFEKSNIASIEAKDSALVASSSFNDQILPDVSYSFTAVKGTPDTSGELATFTVKLNNAVAEDTQFAIADESNLYDNKNAEHAVGDEGDMVATNATIEGTGGSDVEATPVPVLKEVALSDAISTTPEEVNAKDTPDAGVSDYYIIPNVKVGDDDAAYGDDYVATIETKDGSTKELTKAEYANLMSGNFGAVKDLCEEAGIEKMGDVISKLGLKIYNKDATVNPKLIYVTTDEEGNTINEIQNDDDEPITVDDGGNNNPTSDKTPSISVKSSTTQVTAGEGTVVKVYVDKITNENTDGKLTVTISDGALDLVTGSGIAFVDSENENSPVALKADGTTANEIEVGSASDKYIKFVGASKGSIKFTFNYTAKGDVTGEEVSAKAVDKTITIKAPTTTNGGGGSGSGSSSSGNGAIATGLVDIGGTGSLFGFTDMADASWATDAVNALAAQKIVSGVGDNKFDPNGALTRAAYAQMLVNAIGHSQDSADTEFYDVPTDAWFYHNVAVAAQLGIVSGYGDGNFGPYDLITREQMALMTQKAAVVMAKSLVGADAGQFTDDADIADWSRDAVYQLANAGIINGMGDGTFAPKANATRAQAAVIIYNTFVK